MEVVTLSESVPISIDKNIMSGAPVFRGTRVPIRTLFDYIADGSNVNDFLDSFPTVRREQVIKLLDFVTNSLVIGVRAI